MVFQSYALFPHMSVLENVRYGLVVSGKPKPEADERARAALATVGLTGLDARLPSELSGGQQQRVAVARALVLEPSVLLFDEPLSNLDARLRRQMREEIRDLQQRLNLTVVYVTHDQSEAMAVSDRIIVMDKAVIAQEGAPRELYEQPRDAFVAGFMGDANRVRGVIARRDAMRADVTLGPVTLSLPHGGAADGECEVAIRPEAIELRYDGDAPLTATVKKASYLGQLMEYTLDTPIGALFVISTAVDRPLAVGAVRRRRAREPRRRRDPRRRDGRPVRFAAPSVRRRRRIESRWPDFMPAGSGSCSSRRCWAGSTGGSTSAACRGRPACWSPRSRGSRISIRRRNSTIAAIASSGARATTSPPACCARRSIASTAAPRSPRWTWPSAGVRFPTRASSTSSISRRWAGSSTGSRRISRRFRWRPEALIAHGAQMHLIPATKDLESRYGSCDPARS